MELYKTSTLNLGFSHFIVSWRFDKFCENYSARGTRTWLESAVLFAKAQLAKALPLPGAEHSLYDSCLGINLQMSLKHCKFAFQEYSFCLNYFFSFDITTNNLVY